MLTPRQRHQAKKDAWRSKKAEARKQHPEWFEARNPQDPTSRLPDKADPIYHLEKSGHTSGIQPVRRYRKKVRRG